MIDSRIKNKSEFSEVI
ncbi:hypothetical protein CAEBREN_02526 [Caenorhabditis brenneri]|uniref:Uncharacterized protein n=1 Tax=Caenorhabditis brenneri TaxID=135651 RepID=G0NKB8_CAEBE|nr:hypothetical protein CAEBREN_02526 [Caenorhabditis brenneri]